MPPYDKLLHDENVRMCFRLDFFHMLERQDLEDELKRLDEKHQRYLKTTNEWTDRTNKRIHQIKEFLKNEINYIFLLIE